MYNQRRQNFAKRSIFSKAWYHTFGVVFFIHHNLGTGNSSISTKFLTETCIIYGIIQVLHIQVDTLVTIDALNLPLLELRLQIHLPLCPFLRPGSIKLFSVPILSTESFHSLVNDSCLLADSKCTDFILFRQSSVTNVHGFHKKTNNISENSQPIESIWQNKEIFKVWSFSGDTLYLQA